MMTSCNRPVASSKRLAEELPALHPPSPLPEVAEGWATGPPDFVGVGTMKAGTTWWWSTIAAHPDVAARSVGDLYQAKEVHFFDHYGRVEDVDPAVYHRHFPRPPGAITGEWTPRYMYDFWTPPMLRAAAPEALLLVMLRDPVERYLSGIAHHVANELPINAAVKHAQFERGLYWQQLAHLLDRFERERVLILQYERCVADPEREARRTFRFLELDPDRWTGQGRVHHHVGNPPRGAAPGLDAATRDAVRRAYAASTRRLLAEFPELDAALWPSVS